MKRGNEVPFSYRVVRYCTHPKSAGDQVSGSTAACKPHRVVSGEKAQARHIRRQRFAHNFHDCCEEVGGSMEFVLSNTMRPEEKYHEVNSALYELLTVRPCL
jgi:hypothetical protein